MNGEYTKKLKKHSDFKIRNKDRAASNFFVYLHIHKRNN